MDSYECLPTRISSGNVVINIKFLGVVENKQPFLITLKILYTDMLRNIKLKKSLTKIYKPFKNHLFLKFGPV